MPFAACLSVSASSANDDTIMVQMVNKTVRYRSAYSMIRCSGIEKASTAWSMVPEDEPLTREHRSQPAAHAIPPRGTRDDYTHLSVSCNQQNGQQNGARKRRQRPGGPCHPRRAVLGTDYTIPADLIKSTNYGMISNNMDSSP
jgi:hypothetical protein